MWQIAKARGQFQRHNCASAAGLAASLATAGEADALARMLGEAAPHGEHANFQVLNDLMESIHVAGTSGGRDSRGVYCGLSPYPRTAESDSGAKGAWIAISPKYVALLERVAAIAIAFPRLLREVALVERSHGHAVALDMLGNTRSSAFHYWRMLWHEADPEFDTPEVWRPSLNTNECLAVTRAALLFTICHEVAHLTQGDCSSRSDVPLLQARTARAQRVPVSIWPERLSHQSELTADRAAIDIAAMSSHAAGVLPTLMLGSAISTIALALDGWNIDRSAVSDSHPSPFLRLDCLAAYWCDALESAAASGWRDLRRPTPSELERFAQLWGMGGWVAGRYRDGRDGLDIFDDVNDMWGHTLKAAGHHGVFLNSHTPGG